MKIAFLGDIAFFGKCSFNGNSNIKEYFLEVADYLEKLDYIIANLETPFSIIKKTYGAKSAYIYADPVDVNLIKLLHVDTVTLANNHLYDYGNEGALLTQKLLEVNGINFFGVNGKDFKLEKDGNKLAFLGFCCYSSNPLNAVPYGLEGVNEFNVEMVEKLMKMNAANGYLNVLAVHAGIEHINYPSLDTIKAARQLSNVAPYIYYGHHPHVVQGIEEKNGSLIAYSLGNFCFDDVFTSISKEPLVKLSKNNRSSIILEVEIENNKVKSYKTVPIYIGKDKIYLGKGVTEDALKEYSDALNIRDENEYNIMRNKILYDYYGKRKAQRNLAWFLKRLRPRYVQLLFTNRNNAKKYAQCVKKHLK